MPRGRLPTGMVATTENVPPSITVTSPERSFETYIWYAPVDWAWPGSGQNSSTARARKGRRKAGPRPGVWLMCFSGKLASIWITGRVSRILQHLFAHPSQLDRGFRSKFLANDRLMIRHGLGIQAQPVGDVLDREAIDQKPQDLEFPVGKFAGGIVLRDMADRQFVCDVGG